MRSDEAGARALSGGFLSSLVHDVAVVHGMLRHLGCRAAAAGEPRRPVRRRPRRPARLRPARRRARIHDPPQPAGRSRLHRAHHGLLPRPHHRADVSVALSAPLPDPAHGATQRRRVSRSRFSDHRSSYEEAFREELRAFHAAATRRGAGADDRRAGAPRHRAADLRIPKGRWHEDRRLLGFASAPRPARAVRLVRRARRRRHRAGRRRLGTVAAPASRHRHHRGAPRARPARRRASRVRHAARRRSMPPATSCIPIRRSAPTPRRASGRRSTSPWRSASNASSP